MRRFYSATAVFGLTFLLGGAIGCHQEPAIPVSAIPPTCQVYSIANINEGLRDTTYYQYNAFGSVEEINYRQWINERVANSSRQKFVYSTDHYLISQTEQTTTGQTQESKVYAYTYQDGQVQQVSIANAQSGQTTGFRLYAYEAGKIKTYTETNAQKVPLQNYTFDATGKLVQATEASSDIQLTNGKITKKTRPDGTVINTQFDNQGQLLSETTTSATAQSELTFTYDNRPYWNKTQLLFRGILPLDLGGHAFIHNVATSSLRQIQNGRTVRDQSFTYQYQFNKANYSVGYSRSDGMRQRIAYANCL